MATLEQELLGLIDNEDGNEEKKEKTFLADDDDEDDEDGDVDFDTEDDDDDDEEEEEEEEEQQEEQQEEEEEEEEVVPLKKRKMEENVKDDDEEEIVFNIADYEDGYASDLMGDEEDRKRLINMTELEREMELYDRQEKRDELRRQKEIMLTLIAEREAKKPKETRSTRQKKSQKVDKRRSALDEILARRDKTTTNKSLLRQTDEIEYEDYEEDYDSDENYMSEEEAPRRRRANRKTKGRSDDLEDGQIYIDTDTIEASTVDINKVRMTRRKLLAWYNEPFFEDIMPGQFLKSSIGGRMGADEKEVAIYRLVKVIEVKERSSTYNIERNVKSITNKWLKVAIGESTNYISMNVVSNSDITEAEFNLYCQKCEKDGTGMPTQGDCRLAREAQTSGENFRYTEEEVKKQIEKKRKDGYKSTNYAADKQRLAALKERAIQQDDTEQVAYYEKAIKEMEEKYMLELKKRSMGKGQAIRDLNKRNAAKNFISASSKKDKSKIDLDSIRRTRPTNYWGAGRKNMVISNIFPGEEKTDKNKEEEELFEEINDDAIMDNIPGVEIPLNVDLSLLKLPKQRPKLRLSSSFSPERSKCLSLDEYKRRMGII